MKEKSGRFTDYLSMIKFSHTVFAMPFALTGYFLAASKPEYGFSIKLFVLVVLCMVFARSAAMAFNRYIDQRFDALNPRTSSRELPAGKISPGAALTFVIASSLLFIVAAGFINRLTLLLSPVALAVVLGYSFTKRFTALCHFILGLGLSLAPIGAYISVTGRFDILPLIYSAIVLTWVGGFDIIYALQDDEFDRKQSLYSIPASLGRKTALRLSMLSHLITAILTVAAGLTGNQGWLYWTGAAIFTIMLVYQHSIVSHSDLSRVTIAFAAVNGFAGLAFGAFAIADLFL